MAMWLEEYSESIQQILRVLAFNKSLKASEISRITGFHRQTVYKGLAVLLKAEKIDVTGEGTRQVSLSNNVNPAEIMSFFETEDKYGIFALNGESIDSIPVPGSFRATFFDFGFLPTGAIYGCQIFLESIPKSTITQFRIFSDNLKKLHYRLEEVYWTIDFYSGSDGAKFGVGISSFIKTITQERENKKAAVNVTFAIQDWFGGYIGFIYNIQARWINHDLNTGILDQIKLQFILDRIPISKKFAISWSEQGLLPFVEEYVITREEIINDKINVSEKHILGFVDRFGHEIIFNIPPNMGLPTKLLSRMRNASMTIEDLTAGKPVHLNISKYKINPRHSIDPSFIHSGHSELELICAVISD